MLASLYSPCTKLINSCVSAWIHTSVELDVALTSCTNFRSDSAQDAQRSEEQCGKHCKVAIKTSLTTPRTPSSRNLSVSARTTNELIKYMQSASAPYMPITLLWSATFFLRVGLLSKALYGFRRALCTGRGHLNDFGKGQARLEQATIRINYTSRTPRTLSAEPTWKQCCTTPLYLEPVQCDGRTSDATKMKSAITSSATTQKKLTRTYQIPTLGTFGPSRI